MDQYLQINYNLAQCSKEKQKRAESFPFTTKHSTAAQAARTHWPSLSDQKLLLQHA